MSDDTRLRGAVYGAAGALGEQILLALEGEGLPIEPLVAVASGRSGAETVTWRGGEVELIGAAAVDIDDLDFAILAVPSAAAAELRPVLVEAGVLVCDASAAGRGDLSIPLIWPAINLAALADHEGAFAVPCAPAATLGPLLAALLKVATIAQVEAVVIHSAGVAGAAGPVALSSQTMAMLSHRIVDAGPFGVPLAFDVLPGGPPEREDPAATLALELRRLLPALETVPLGASSVQVPTFTGTALSVAIRATEELDPAVVGRALSVAPDLDRNEDTPTLRAAVDRDEVLVGDVRVQGDTIRCFLAADGLTRTALAISGLLGQVAAKELW